MRTTNGAPIKSGKYYGLTSWRDAKESSEYLYSTYGKPSSQRMYISGISLGASVVAVYLVEEDGKHPYSGAVLFSVPFDATYSGPLLRQSHWGAYDKVLGVTPKATFAKIYP